MEWEDREESQNVEDQRGKGRTGIMLGGGGIIVVLIALFWGSIHKSCLGCSASSRARRATGRRSQAIPLRNDSSNSSGSFSGIPNASGMTLFGQMGKKYEKLHLVLFDEPVSFRRAVWRGSRRGGAFLLSRRP